jgi:hypothetical protein
MTSYFNILHPNPEHLADDMLREEFKLKRNTVKSNILALRKNHNDELINSLLDAMHHATVFELRNILNIIPGIKLGTSTPQDILNLVTPKPQMPKRRQYNLPPLKTSPNDGLNPEEQEELKKIATLKTDIRSRVCKAYKRKNIDLEEKTRLLMQLRGEKTLAELEVHPYGKATFILERNTRMTIYSAAGIERIRGRLEDYSHFLKLKGLEVTPNHLEEYLVSIRASKSTLNDDSDSQSSPDTSPERDTRPEHVRFSPGIKCVSSPGETESS